MSNEIRVGMIGLDTSHSVLFTKHLQAPDCPPEQHVNGARVVSCMRFSTPFQSEEGLDERQKILEGWGVKVTTSFEEAVADCDAIALEINDPAYHLDYFTKCADLGKPIFLDKPMADNTANARKIYDIAKSKGLRAFSSSSLRYVAELVDACETVSNPILVTTYGPLGVAPAGSSIVWYGVHAFEMLERAMGRGAVAVFARRDKAGVVTIVEYEDNRRGIVELTEGVWSYGGCVRNKEKIAPFIADASILYPVQLKKIIAFFNGAEPPVSFDDSLEITAMLDAAERSVASGKSEKLNI